MHWVLNFKAHQTCTGTNKNKRFQLQSAPNLHRDKKNKSFELQSAPNLHRDKKNKKNENFRGIVAPSQVDCEVIVLFFCPCAGLAHFEV